MSSYRNRFEALIISMSITFSHLFHDKYAPLNFFLHLDNELGQQCLASPHFLHVMTLKLYYLKSDMKHLINGPS